MNKCIRKQEKNKKFKSTLEQRKAVYQLLQKQYEEIKQRNMYGGAYVATQKETKMKTLSELK